MAINPSDLANGQVVTGFSFPVVAIYNNNNGAVSYTYGMDLARGVKLDPQLETTDDSNAFYANNRTAETAQRRFRAGTLKLTVDGLLVDAEKLIMGLGSGSVGSVTVGTGSSAVTVATTDYGDAQDIPYVGVGAIVRSQSNGVELFRAVVYPKVRFEQFSITAQTQGEEIDWQTSELSAKISRDDTSNHNWQRFSEVLETELEAYNAVRAMLGLSVAAALPTT